MKYNQNTENTNYRPNVLDKVISGMIDFTREYVPRLTPIVLAAGIGVMSSNYASAQTKTPDLPSKKPVPAVVDSDKDGIADNLEIKIYKTNPKKADSDGDGVRDDIEIYKDRTDPTDPKDYKGAPAPGTIDKEVQDAMKDMQNPPKMTTSKDSDTEWFSAGMIGGGTYGDIRANIAKNGKHSLIGYAGTQFGLGYDFDDSFGVNVIGSGSGVGVDLGWHPGRGGVWLARAGYIASLEEEVKMGPESEQFPSLGWVEAGRKFSIDDKWSIIAALNAGALTGTDESEVKIGGMGMLSYDGKESGFRLGAGMVGGEPCAGVFYVWGAKNNLPTLMIYSAPKSIKVNNPNWRGPGSDGISGTDDDHYSDGGDDGGDGSETGPTIPSETNPGPTTPPVTPPTTPATPPTETGPTIPPVTMNIHGLDVLMPSDIDKSFDKILKETYGKKGHFGRIV